MLDEQGEPIDLDGIARGYVDYVASLPGETRRLIIGVYPSPVEAEWWNVSLAACAPPFPLPPPPPLGPPPTVPRLRAFSPPPSLPHCAFSSHRPLLRRDARRRRARV